MGRKSRGTTQFTNWCFTWNNYNETSADYIVSLIHSGEVAFVAMSEEVGKKGTPHLQGYLQLIKKCMQ